MRLAVALVLAVLLAATPIADATPDDDFKMAKASFRKGEFSKVIAVISALLYPENQLEAERDIIEAHLLLGVSYFQIGDKSAAGTQFERALRLDASLSISPPLFTEEASDFFKSKKDELEEKEDLTRKAEEAARLRFIIDNMLVSERRLFYANFIPFGVGQFQNGDRGKGIFFLTSQIATVGASTGLFAYQFIRYPGGKIPASDIRQVETIQVIQVSTGVLAIGLIVAGILDAWYNYEPTVLRKPDPKLLEEWEKLRVPKKKPSGLSSFKIVPTATDESFGAAVFLEF